MSKKKKQKKRLSRIIRISRPVDEWLTQHRRGKESFDTTLRRLFGLADKKGTPPETRTYFILDNEGEPFAYCDRASARGAAITLAIRKSKKRPERILEAWGVS